MKLDDLMDALLTGLPGEDLVRRGLADFQSNRCTVPACLVHIARPRLMQSGLLPQDGFYAMIEPEIQLYRLLKQEKGDAYSRYNSLLRELISFEMALDHRLQKRKD